MNSQSDFPEELLLHEPDRSRRLVQEFYEQYHETARTRDAAYERKGRHDETKAAFFRKALAARSHDGQSIGLDVGCRGGVMIRLVGLIRWIGVDIDEKALAIARAGGIPCTQMDFTTQLGFRADSFDAVRDRKSVV